MLAGEQDLVVINSCAVTAEAVRQTRQAIRRARKARPDARLLVTGCAAEVERDVLAAMPEVDGLVANAAQARSPRLERPRRQPRSSRRRSHPRLRPGAERLRPCLHLLRHPAGPRAQPLAPSRPTCWREIERHLDAGVREVVLTGVDLTTWGTDLPGAPRLGALVSAILDAFPALERLRLSSLDGIEIDPELFELIAGEPRVMPHLHLSLQSGDDLDPQADEAPPFARAMLCGWSNACARAAPTWRSAPTSSPAFRPRTRRCTANPLDRRANSASSTAMSFPIRRAPARRPRACRRSIARDDQAPRRRTARGGRGGAAALARWLDRHAAQRVLAERDGTGHAENFARVRLPGGIAGRRRRRPSRRPG